MPQLTFEAMTDAALNLGCTGLMWFTDKNGRKQRTTIWEACLCQTMAADVQQAD